MTPHRCPCCDGWGSRVDPWPEGTATAGRVPCVSCGGSGVLWEADPFGLPPPVDPIFGVPYEPPTPTSDPAQTTSGPLPTYDSLHPLT